MQIKDKLRTWCHVLQDARPYDGVGINLNKEICTSERRHLDNRCLQPLNLQGVSYWSMAAKSADVNFVLNLSPYGSVKYSDDITM